MDKTLKNRALIGIFILLSVISVACDNTRVYEEWLDIKDAQWNEDSSVCFTFNIEDSTALYNLNFGVRNTNLYPYQNLWLLTSIDGPANFSYQDKVQMVLAKDNGEWYGRRSASLYTYTVRMYSGLQFAHPGEYRIELKHGMRQAELKGMSSVGVRLEYMN